MPESTAVNSASKQMVQINAGAEKQGRTIMLAITSNTWKLPPYVLFKQKTMAKVIPLGCYNMDQGKWLHDWRCSRKLE
jgi:hypothetical protein